MPKPEDYSPLAAPAPVTPPTLRPISCDIPQNPGSELHRLLPSAACRAEVASATLDLSPKLGGLHDAEGPTQYPH